MQYFERARFEFHPENSGTEHEVLLGRLGDTLLDTRYNLTDLPLFNIKDYGAVGD